MPGGSLRLPEPQSWVGVAAGSAAVALPASAAGSQTLDSCLPADPSGRELRAPERVAPLAELARDTLGRVSEGLQGLRAMETGKEPQDSWKNKADKAGAAEVEGGNSLRAVPSDSVKQQQDLAPSALSGPEFWGRKVAFGSHPKRGGYRTSPKDLSSFPHSLPDVH